jgi:hypothetical protein
MNQGMTTMNTTYPDATTKVSAAPSGDADDPMAHALYSKLGRAIMARDEAKARYHAAEREVASVVEAIVALDEPAG